MKFSKNLPLCSVVAVFQDWLTTSEPLVTSSASFLLLGIGYSPPSAARRAGGATLQLDQMPKTRQNLYLKIFVNLTKKSLADMDAYGM